MTDCMQVPLRELLRGAPADARLVIDDADGKGTRYTPVGRYCHEAADELERLTERAERAEAALAASQQQAEPVARVIDNGTPEGATEWLPFSMRMDPLKTGDLLYASPRITAAQADEIKRLADVMADRGDGDSRLYFEARTEFHAALDALLAKHKGE